MLSTAYDIRFRTMNSVIIQICIEELIDYES